MLYWERYALPGALYLSLTPVCHRGVQLGVVHLPTMAYRLSGKQNTSYIHRYYMHVL